MHLDHFTLVDVPLQMFVTDPITGVNSDAILHLLSPYDPVFIKRKQAIARRVLAKAMQLEQTDFDMELHLTAAAIAGWESLYQNNVPLAYNEQNAVTLLQNAPWLREQIVFFYNDATQFFKAPPHA